MVAPVPDDLGDGDIVGAGDLLANVVSREDSHGLTLCVPKTLSQFIER
jgi:hypothetical protein